MTDMDRKIARAKRGQRRRRERRILASAKAFMEKAIIAAGLVTAAYLYTGMYDGPVKLIETEYTVKRGDTLWNIGETYLEKNTGGRRYILEFLEGIKELNPWLVETKGQLQPGQMLRINYFVKEETQDDR